MSSGPHDEPPVEVSTAGDAASATPAEAPTAPADSVTTGDSADPDTVDVVSAVSTDDASATPDPPDTDLGDLAPPDAAVPPAPRPEAGPSVPAGQAKAPPPMVDPGSHSRPAGPAWYRSDEDRARSVYRRANPWYRRLTRGIIGLAFLIAGGLGLYFGARAVQDYLERDRLPAAGPDVPEIRSTTFIVTSSAPAPQLDGTLTIDTETAAFEFVGRADGPQSGVQVVSPDGSTIYVRQGAGPWRSVAATDSIAAEVTTAVDYLIDADTADAILTNGLRRGFVELDAKVDEGSGSDQLTRYEMIVDSQRFAEQLPLQWQSFQDEAIPGVEQNTAAPITIWLDDADVLVRVRDEPTSWAWERLTYSDQVVFIPDPADGSQTQIVQVACVSEDNSIFWQTPFASCAEAMIVARELAVETGVAEPADITAGDRTIALLCSTMERETGPIPATAEEADLATALVENGVCRGDPAIFEVG